MKIETTGASRVTSCGGSRLLRWLCRHERYRLCRQHRQDDDDDEGCGYYSSWKKRRRRGGGKRGNLSNRHDDEECR